VKKFNTVNALFPPGERTTSVHSFCEELVVRKELSDNFCFYNDSYMTIGGAHNWAQTTLQEHWNDPREVIYSQEQLETAQTADNLWNSAQLEMVTFLLLSPLPFSIFASFMAVR
jgi:deoxyribodipyrimidine photolyase